MKKIGLYITDITNCAGTERVIVNLANYLVSNGYLVTIVSFSSRDGEPFFHVDEKIKIIHLGLEPYEFKGFIVKVIFIFRNLIRFLYLNKENEFDVVIGSSRNTNVYALIGKKSNKQKIIGCEHFAWNVPMFYLLRIIRNFLYRKLDRLVVLTKRDEHYYQAIGVNAFHIPNALSIKEEDCVDKKENIAIAVGRHSSQKAFNKLLNIWAKAQPFTNDWQLYIIGDGDLLSTNIKIAESLGIEDSVIFIPPTKDITKYYRRASLYLMTSIYEAFPMVLLEAKAYCLPVVSYDCDTGPREIIRDNLDGFLIPNDSERLFLEKLELLILNNKKRRQFGFASFVNSREFSPERIMPKWLELIHNMVS